MAELSPKRVAVLYTPVEDTLQEVEEPMRIEMDLAVSAREVTEALASRGHISRCVAFDTDPAALAGLLRMFEADVVSYNFV